MHSISVSYALKWRVKFAPYYKVTDCGKVFNTRTNRQLKRVVNNRCVGYWIKGKFYSLTKLRQLIEKIPKEKCPF